MEKSDSELIAEYKEGDENSLRLLLNRHLKPFYNFILRLTKDKNASEDIVQESFLKVWKNLWRYDARKNFRAWLYLIGRNTAFDFLRRKKEVAFSEMDDEDGISFGETVPSDEEGAEEFLMRMEDKEETGKLLEELEPKEREIILLRYGENMSFKEIGRVIGRPLNTAKSIHFRALRKLKKMLSDKKS